MSLSDGFRDSKLMTLRSSNSQDLTQGDACVTVFASAFQDHRRRGQLHCPAGLRLGQRGAGGYSHRSFCHQQEVSTKAAHRPHPLPRFSEGAFCLLHTKRRHLISIINTAFASPTCSLLFALISLHPCWSCGLDPGGSPHCRESQKDQANSREPS